MRARLVGVSAIGCAKTKVRSSLKNNIIRRNGILLFSFFLVSCAHTPFPLENNPKPAQIEIVQNHGRYLFNGPQGGFFSIGMNSFMEGYDNPRLKKITDSKNRCLTYEYELTRLRDLGFNSLGGWTQLDCPMPSRVFMPSVVVLFDDVDTPHGTRTWNLKEEDGVSPISSIDDPGYREHLTQYLEKKVVEYKNNPVLCYAVGAEIGLGDSDAIDYPLPIVRDWLAFVTSTLRKLDPGKLICSPKLSVWDFGPYLNEPIQKHHFDTFEGMFDLLAVDWYSKQVTPSQIDWHQLDEVSIKLGIPVFVAEFGTRQAIPGWNNTPGAKSIVQTQAERASRYKTQMEFFFSKPNIVGVHWFRWQDQLSSEHQFNKGIVKVEDGTIRPYSELTQEMKLTNQAIKSAVSESR